MNLHRFTVAAIPVALAGFVVVLALHLRQLPPEIPVQFGAEPGAARTVSSKTFQAIITGLAGSLALILLLARWAMTLPGYDADGRFQRHPQLLPRTLVLLDLLGAAGITLITWTAYLCATASRMPDPVLPRAALLVPLTTLGALAFLGWRWIRAARH
jgi:hypothetical protein